MNILCVTPNVAIDRVIRVPEFAPGGVWRATASALTCGGKGVNVARALRRLGHHPVCAGLIGGETGCRAADGARAEGLDAAWTWIDGETRTCIILVDDHATASVVNEPGPMLAAGDWDRLVEDVEAAARACEAVCICGSVPPNAPAGALTALIAAAPSERPVWVDAGGDVLADALRACPSGVKINADEASALLERPVTTPHEAARAAVWLREHGAAQAVVTLAADGAVLADENGCWLARPPVLGAVNTVASGDAFLAGLLAGFADGLDPGAALRLATAAGAANTQSFGLADIDARVVARLRARTSVEAIDAV